MSKAHSAPMLPEALPGNLSGAAVFTRNAGIILAGTVLAAVCARVSVPLYFTPVPLSLAPFAVLLLGLLLTPRMAAATFAAYLAEGALGLPVFAPSPLNGIAHLLGPTGGYLLAYPLAAWLISWMFRRATSRMGRGFTAAVLSAAAGDLIILASGALWLVALPHLTAGPATELAILPFLPGDALKITAAAALAKGFVQFRRPTRFSHPT